MLNSATYLFTFHHFAIVWLLCVGRGSGL